MNSRIMGNKCLVIQLFALLSVMFSTSVAYAASDTGFSIPSADLKIAPGEAKTMHINLANAEFYYGLQLDLTLPSGLTIDIKDGVLDISVAAPHEIHGNFIEEKNCYRLIAYNFSAQQKTFTSSVNLITFNVTAASDFTGGELKITDGVLVEENPDGTAATFMETLTDDKSFQVVADIPEVEVVSVSLDKTTVTVMDSESVTLKASVNPANATNRNLTWTSADSSIATVDNNGVVTGKKAGQTNVTVTSDNGKSASCTVTVTATPATSVTIAKPATTTLKVGESVTLTATVAPDNATVKTVVWSSSAPAVAAVDNNGKVTAVAYGTAKITATCGNVSDNVTFTVHNYITALSLSATELSIELDKTGKAEVSYLPAQPEAVELSWTSSNPEIATVSADGVITPKAIGKTVITVTDSYTHLSASCNVTVTDIRYGDVNDDGVVTVDDINLMVGHILAKNPSPFNVRKADIDKNNRINIVDIAYAVQIALKENPAALRRAIEELRSSTRTTSPDLQFDALSLDADGVVAIPFNFRTLDNIPAIQADVILPPGLEIEQVMPGEALSAKHTLSFMKLSDNTVRFMIYSPSLAPLVADVIRLKINVTDEADLTQEVLGEALFTNILASNTNGRGVPLDDFAIQVNKGLLGTITDVMAGQAEVTAIAGAIQIMTDEPSRVEIYNTAGTLVSKFTSTGTDTCKVVKGLYVVIVGSRTFKVLVF